MKLSDFTLTILKNFASINSGLVFQKGKRQRTLATDKSIFADVDIIEDMPEVFGIYDLSTFLGNVTTLNSPELTFTDKSVIMTDGSVTLTYYGCSPSLIVFPDPSKEINLTNVDVSFWLEAPMLNKMLKLAAMNKLTSISVVGKDGDLFLKTHDKDSDTSNYITTKLGEYDGDDLSVTLNVSNLKFIPDDYKVEVQKDGFANFTNKAGNIRYTVALQVESK